MQVIVPKSLYYAEANARWLQAKHKFSEAITWYSDLIKKDKKEDWLISRAECYVALTNYNAALNDISDALDIDSTNGYLYLLKAKVKKLQYENADAELLKQQAIKYGISQQYADMFMEL